MISTESWEMIDEFTTHFIDPDESLDDDESYRILQDAAGLFRGKSDVVTIEGHEIQLTFHDGRLRSVAV